MEKKQLKPYQGIIVFVLVILMLIFVAAPIQMELGMTGVLITEFLVLLCGVIPAILFKADLKEVFPIKRPKLRQIFGVLILWGGTLLFVLVVTLVMAYFFPEGLLEVNSSLQDIFTSVPMLVSFLIVAVSPAICEEALVRGFILSSFSSLKNKWLIVLIVGVLFGIFHLDPYRFLPTAILGMTLSYIMVETKNILLPAIYHFVNNGFSVLSSFLTTGSTQAELTETNLSVPLISVGVYFIIGAAVPFVLLLGSRLLHSKEEFMDVEAAEQHSARKRKGIYMALACTVIMFVAGFAISVFAVTQPEFKEFMEEYANTTTPK